jgi:hypothetical protein
MSAGVEITCRVYKPAALAVDVLACPRWQGRRMLLAARTPFTVILIPVDGKLAIKAQQK